jgi:hypothetical protein
MANLIKSTAEGFSEAGAAFASASIKAGPAGFEAMQRIVFRVMEISVDNKLSGQVLRRRTGTLARSVAQSPRVYSSADGVVIGTVGTANIIGDDGRAPVKYGALHEWGGTYEAQVREHMRAQKQAFGRPVAPRQVSVRAHIRRGVLPERSFLRSALSDFVASGGFDEEINRMMQGVLNA